MLVFLQAIFLRVPWKMSWAKLVAVEEPLGFPEQAVVPLPGRLPLLFGAGPLLLVGRSTLASVFPSPFAAR